MLDVETRPEQLKRLVTLYRRLQNEKALKAGLWQDQLRYTMPWKAGQVNPTARLYEPFDEVFDASGMLGASEFAANLCAYASPPNRRWFLLAVPPGSRFARTPQYRDYLGSRGQDLHAAFALSNFDTEIQSSYEDLAHGTCCLASDRSERPGVAFSLSARPLSEYNFLECEGQPETVFVERQFTGAEAADRFGAKVLPEDLRRQLRQLDDNAYTNVSPYLNIIRPNKGWDPVRIGPGGYPFTSLWLDLNHENNLLEVKGLHRQHYTIARFWRSGGQPWGYGPSQMAYGPVRCLDKAMEIVLKYAAKTMDPPSVWPSEDSFWPLSVQPGARVIGQFDAMSKAKPEFLEIHGDHRVTQFIFEYLSSQIARAYLTHVFQVLTDNKQRTAREVAAILEKEYTLAIPIFARLRRELFTPLVRNCLELMTEYELGIYGWRYGGEPLPDYEYQLELISPLGLAVKYAELQNLNDLVALNGPLAQIDGRVWDNYSLDDMSRAIGDNLAVPRSWLRSIGERDAIRAKVAELAARQEAAAEVQSAARAARDLGVQVQAA